MRSMIAAVRWINKHLEEMALIILLVMMLVIMSVQVALRQVFKLGFRVQKS